MISKIARRLRWLKLIIAGATVDYTVQIHDELLKGNASGFKCEKNAWFSEGTKILIGSHQGKIGQLSIGYNFYINHYSIIDCHYSITIAERVKIGPYCYICDFDHDISIDSDTRIKSDGIAAPVKIEKDVWVGAGAIILKGVTIGEGAIVGAGSVVTKDVEAKAIVVGNPAHFLRIRENHYDRK